MALFVVVAVAVAAWLLLRRRRTDETSGAAEKLRVWLRWVRRGLLVALGLAMFSALTEGCDGVEGPAGAERQPCTSFYAEDCPAAGVPVPSTTVPPEVPGGDAERLPCPAYDAEDCPVAPAAGP